MALADVAVDLSEPFVRKYASDALGPVEERFEGLKKRAQDQLLDQGMDQETIRFECFLSLQYQGSDTTLMIARPEDNDFARAFVEEHKREFAFVSEADIMVAGVRVRATSKSISAELEGSSPWAEELHQLENSGHVLPEPKPFSTNSTYFEEVGRFTDIPLYRLHDLVPGMLVSGPAIILDNTQTVVLHPQNKARILRSHIL